MALVLEEARESLLLVGEVQVDAVYQEFGPAAQPGNVRLASATTVPVGAMIRLGPSRVECACVPAWLAWTHHWLFVSASAGCRRSQAGARSTSEAEGARTRRAPAEGQGAGDLGQVAVEADRQPDRGQHGVAKVVSR